MNPVRFVLRVPARRGQVARVNSHSEHAGPRLHRRALNRVRIRHPKVALLSRKVLVEGVLWVRVIVVGLAEVKPVVRQAALRVVHFQARQRRFVAEELALQLLFVLDSELLAQILLNICLRKVLYVFAWELVELELLDHVVLVEELHFFVRTQDQWLQVLMLVKVDLGLGVCTVRKADITEFEGYKG